MRKGRLIMLASLIIALLLLCFDIYDEVITNKNKETIEKKAEPIKVKDIAFYPEQTWQIVKSPISGECYEVLIFRDWEQTFLGLGYMGMAKTECEEGVVTSETQLKTQAE